MFTQGEVYRRRELHEKYGGQQQGGISTPSEHNLIFLFTSERGEEHGYSDGWKDNKIFLYTGEGQRGDMTFTRGNKAIRDHLEDGKDIHMFRQTRKGYVEYVGQMIYSGYHHKDGPDTDGIVRKMIVFELAPVE
ncbi:MAG: HNH endonuclease [Anaerolineae bacterium]|nr:HNH endonuclease [Anaerolineae bacterium]